MVDDLQKRGAFVLGTGKFCVRFGRQKACRVEVVGGIWARVVEAVARKHLQLLQISHPQAELRGNHAHRFDQRADVPEEESLRDHRSK